MRWPMQITAATLKVTDADGHEIVVDQTDIQSFEVRATANFHDFLTGGPWAPDGRTRRHHLHWGNDLTITVTFTYHEAVPATETIGEPY